MYTVNNVETTVTVRIDGDGTMTADGAIQGPAEITVQRTMTMFQVHQPSAAAAEHTTLPTGAKPQDVQSDEPTPSRASRLRTRAIALIEQIAKFAHIVLAADPVVQILRDALPF
ncbi:hypothetical protein ADK60_20410 [Streptomyces sp. XY431]|uniref:hypothetical protein n=1 Tax=Streptomyces sp. XY431 TaxID=1415562 RepID=UPI0006B051BB|nr:hypothetical protein [Streptomyces sp. XY431]KOV26906.1 hypothetical protein ADK60_20410 [Streptomyces sp. XY431]